jgi:hypothetical protein
MPAGNSAGQRALIREFANMRTNTDRGPSVCCSNGRCNQGCRRAGSSWRADSAPSWAATYNAVAPPSIRPFGSAFSPIRDRIKSPSSRPAAVPIPRSTQAVTPEEGETPQGLLSHEAYPPQCRALSALGLARSRSPWPPGGLPGRVASGWQFLMSCLAIGSVRGAPPLLNSPSPGGGGGVLPGFPSPRSIKDC